jgi:hypothetical protein
MASKTKEGLGDCLADIGKGREAAATASPERKMNERLCIKAR